MLQMERFLKMFHERKEQIFSKLDLDAMIRKNFSWKQNTLYDLIRPGK